ncbi:uncharacterized protein [Triticum aestivum]|uniref:uncharacterized protein n=1 Tax=Triticum aestivum TaxID=4565 RepID=UPI001D0325BD|nr:uncharacterized protein LOC123104684 [Triticum aestivum]
MRRRKEGGERKRPPVCEVRRWNRWGWLLLPRFSYGMDMYAEYPLTGQDWILVYTSPPLSCSGINTLLQMFFVSRLLVVMGGSYSFAMPTISMRYLLPSRIDFLSHKSCCTQAKKFVSLQ